MDKVDNKSITTVAYNGFILGPPPCLSSDRFELNLVDSLGKTINLH